MSRSGERILWLPLPEGSLVVAVSGGVDSMVLLSRCLAHPYPIIAAHVNYRKRGAASNADEELVRSFCEENGITCCVARAPDFTEQANFQHEARTFRYQFFERVRTAHKASAIVTAHHADDDTETLLFRLFRDGNASALSGIPQNSGAVYRPLLGVGRDEIERFARENDIPWREDQTNQEQLFTRNRIRKKIIPELDTSFPGWKQKLENLGGLSSDLRELASLFIAHISDQDGLKLADWSALSERLKQLILRQWLYEKHDVAISADWLADAVVKIEVLQTGRKLQLGPGIFLFRDRAYLVLKREEPEVPGEAMLKGLEVGQLPVEVLLGTNVIRLETGRWSGTPDADALELKFDESMFPLTMRRWKSGDAIRPLGMDGTKKISDLLTDQKVPASQKSQIPVIETFDGTLAAVIFSRNHGSPPGVIASAFACAATRQQTLKITLTPKT